jgi:hypothetical protein
MYFRVRVYFFTDFNFQLSWIIHGAFKHINCLALSTEFELSSLQY